MSASQTNVVAVRWRIGAEAAEWGRISGAASCRRRVGNYKCTLALLNMLHVVSEPSQNIISAFNEEERSASPLVILIKKVALKARPPCS
jgi:hypothetical protein